MNELSNLIKSLAYSLTVVPTSSKCIANLARRHELRPELEKLQKGLKRHKSSGYDWEAKNVPIESTVLMLLDRIQMQQPKITDLQKYCSLLTSLERSALLDLIEAALSAMDARSNEAQKILAIMEQKGLSIEDLK
ncbi:hypothetical protein [Marinomonas fungiae]|uniref:Uncharacterized protein n=1 Tax=Marinomonas fungiae TaxID=1137284 RepID=A0A0K6IJB0_9GAMM|nr:hypothetical protein [Marinomonas fungiae]CUB03190.1 hypothetical protein Ga0061065_10338 [Marinomonas fungiae]